MRDKLGEVATELTKATPAVGVVSMNFMGYGIADWVQLATLLYVLFQVHILAKNHVGWYKSMLNWLKGGKKDVTPSKGE